MNRLMVMGRAYVTRASVKKTLNQVVSLLHRG
jgi:hypothetical protein